MRFLSNSELESLSVSERKEYYENIKKQCILEKIKQPQFGQDIIKKIYPLLRGYKIELQGEENIPKDSNVIFLANHSNSHDIFTAYELFSFLQRRGSVMVATDCLNPITTKIFNISNATLLDRRVKEDRQKSVLELSKKILEGKDGLIFGESTWNLHPLKKMHNIRQGVSMLSAITQVPIVPTIFEYIEENEIVNSESKLYKKCVIRFGKPIMINYEDNIINQTNSLKQDMCDLRKNIWDDYGIGKENMNDIDPVKYINHTYVKKFKALGFTYDSRKEQEFILYLNGEPKENEYTITPDGMLFPGVTEKNFKLSKIIKK